jgi:hypothetical protein
MLDEQEMGTKVSRAEWGVVLSLVVSVCTMVFSAGVVYGSVQEHDRRITTLERTIHPLELSVNEIRVNVQFLKDRADEDRKAMRK